MENILNVPFELAQLAIQKGFDEYCFIEFLHDDQGVNKYWANHQNDECGIPSPAPLQLLNWINKSMPNYLSTRNLRIDSKGNDWFLIIAKISPIVKYQGSLCDVLNYALNYFPDKKK